MSVRWPAQSLLLLLAAAHLAACGSGKARSDRNVIRCDPGGVAVPIALAADALEGAWALCSGEGPYPSPSFGGVEFNSGTGWRALEWDNGELTRAYLLGGLPSGGPIVELAQVADNKLYLRLDQDAAAVWWATAERLASGRLRLSFSRNPDGFVPGQGPVGEYVAVSDVREPEGSCKPPMPALAPTDPGQLKGAMVGLWQRCGGTGQDDFQELELHADGTWTALRNGAETQSGPVSMFIDYRDSSTSSGWVFQFNTDASGLRFARGNVSFYPSAIGPASLTVENSDLAYLSFWTGGEDVAATYRRLSPEPWCARDGASTAACQHNWHASPHQSEPPRVDSVEPQNALMGSQILIHGAGFRYGSAKAIFFGTESAVDAAVVDDTTLRATLPPDDTYSGPVTVKLESSGAIAYRLSGPSLHVVDTQKPIISIPYSGSVATGTTQMSILGEHLGPAPTVLIDQHPTQFEFQFGGEYFIQVDPEILEPPGWHWVTASNEAGLVSEPTRLGVYADIRFIGASATSPREIQLQFDRGLDPESVSGSSFSITPNLGTLGARLAIDAKILALRSSADQVPGQTYRVVVPSSLKSFDGVNVRDGSAAVFQGFTP